MNIYKFSVYWFATLLTVLAVCIVLGGVALAQSVGRVGTVGTLMIPDDGAPGNEPQPLGTLDTEADQGLQTEDGNFLTVE